jgi:hypothetical protein
MDAQTVAWILAVAKRYGLPVAGILLLGVGGFMLIRQAIKRGFSVSVDLTVGQKR